MGAGPRTAVLIHGLGNSSDSWWQVGPVLAEHGYHVLAVDLPGHGRSAPLDRYSSAALAAAVVAAVPASPALAIGHSLGGLVLAHAVGELRPELAVYEDLAWILSPDPVVADSFRRQKNWTLEDLEREQPRWSERSRRHKLDALAAWDPRIVDHLGTFTLAPVDEAVVPSLLVLTDPSRLIPPDRAEELVQRGFDVRVVAGAGHVVHFDDPAGFVAALASRGVVGNDHVGNTFRDKLELPPLP
ncbi:2-succinyl-6-hydroxy-2,4-cyclohexadiene-1-carboxylate synthase [Rhodococcus sp. YH1]|nr:2-succinyl-6-hydroxy-2,4-cyclohexadiene-1-carboxylate synthase [Rhodococcus sp. YH1]